MNSRVSDAWLAILSVRALRARTTANAPAAARAAWIVRVPSLLLLPAHRSWKIVLRTEITLDGHHLFTSEPQILNVPEGFTVRGVTDVHHKRLVAGSNPPLQVKPFDKSILCVPASCLESTFTDVIVDWACKCEVVRQHDVER